MPDIRVSALPTTPALASGNTVVATNGTTTFRASVTTTNVGNAIVMRDGSGNFNAGTISATAFNGSGTSTIQALNVSGALTAGTFNPGNVNASGTVTAAGGFTTTGNVQCGTVRASGDVIAYASSDARLKDNKEVISNALAALENINGYSFTFNSNASEGLAGTSAYGLIAQEVESVLPFAVKDREDGVKALAYDQIIGVLVQAVKELKAQVDDLKSKI